MAKKKDSDDLFSDDTIGGFFGKSNAPHEIMTKLRETRSKIKDNVNRKKASKKTKFVIIVLLIAVVFGIIYFLANLWTSILWYKQLGYLDVPVTKYVTVALLFLIGAIPTFILMLFGIKKSLKASKKYTPETQFGLWFKRGQLIFNPFKKFFTYLIPTVFSIFIGTSLSRTWSNFLLFLHPQSFNQKDPIFQKDAGFYVFRLPELISIVQIITLVFAVCLVVFIIILLAYGGIKIRRKHPRILLGKRAFNIVGTFGFLEFLSLAVLFYILRFSYIVVQNKKSDGASFSQVNGNMVALLILSILFCIFALGFIVMIIVKNKFWTKKLINAFAVLVIFVIFIQGIYPVGMQKLFVSPNGQEKESKYIQSNIDATLSAYGLNNVSTVKQNDIKSSDLSKIRLIDPLTISPTFTQLEQVKQYYTFSSTLWPDHYKIDGKDTDVTIGLRELNPKGLSQNNWVNAHTVFTHGFGVVAADGTKVDSDGKPVFIEKNIPSVGKFGKFEQRIYFGMNSPNYSIVGGKNSNYELDYPSDGNKTGQKNYSYPANGGVKVNNFFNKLAYAIKFCDVSFLISDRVKNDSQILYNRNPIKRVNAVAPYLTIDERPYPVVSNGQIYYVVDGYTTSNSYPYSQHVNLKKATTDSVTVKNNKNGISALKSQKVNYIKNSVKALVNAFTGEVTLYAADSTDPILKAWSEIYKNTLKPKSEISSDLAEHFRYPQSLLKVQRQIYSTFHTQDSDAYYSGQNFWQVPNDPIKKAQNNIPTQYLLLQNPSTGNDTAFSEYTPFIPYGGTGSNNRNVLTGYLMASVTKNGDQNLTIIKMPQQTSLPGPGQVQNIFNSDPKVATVLRLLRDGGSQIVNGNLLIIPYKQSFLYVEPVYIQSSYGIKYPILKKVLVYYNGKVGFGDNLKLSLAQVF